MQVNWCIATWTATPKPINNLGSTWAVSGQIISVYSRPRVCNMYKWLPVTKQEN